MIKRPSIGATTWFMAFVVVAVLLTHQSLRSGDHTDENIIFGSKSYSDTGNAYVDVSGTLSGEGIGYSNNTTNIFCDKNSAECWVSSIEQIGHNQLGTLVLRPLSA